MSAQVQLIADGAQLARSLFAASVTVLLLSAPFSSETESALSTVSQAAALTSCPSVQYVHLPLNTAHPLQTPRAWFSYVNDALPAVQKLTRMPPLFPFVRLFRARAEPPTVSEFRGSFDAFVLARFISHACGAQVDLPRALCSRDEFARAVRAHAFGVLLIVHMREGALREEHRAIAFALAHAVEQASSWWVFSVVDSQKDELFAQRVAHDSLLLVHLGDDKAALHALSDVARDQAASLLRRFEQLGRRRVVRDSTLVACKALWYFDAPVSAAKATLRRGESAISLRAFLRGDYSARASGGSVAWAVVVQTWCGYCQRVMGVYERFARVAEAAARADVHVVWVQRAEMVDALPPFVARLVDGFPTVLRLERRGGDGDDGACDVREYVGEHAVRALIGEHAREQRTRLAAAHAALRLSEQLT